MKDSTLTLDIPEELLERAKSAKVDVRQTLIEALERKVEQTLAKSPNRMPTREEIDAALEESTRRNLSGNYPLREYGYLKGQLWIADDFDDELPDEFWFGDQV